MTASTTPIVLKITSAGKQSALQASGDDTKILIDLTHVAVGSSRYTPSGGEVSLANEVGRSDIVSGEVVGDTLRFTSTMHTDEVTPVYEMGVFTKTGVLFAVAASSTDPLVTLYPNIAFVVAFGITITDIDTGSVTVNVDPNASLATAVMQNHLAATDPHPQYVPLSRFQLLLDVMFPVGYLHHTNSTANPKPEFDQLLGIDTAWRRLAGKIIVGTDPSDDYIKDVGLVLGQKGMTTPAVNNERPNVYPLYTKNIFERYNPDDVIETVWNVTADKTSITEGGAVRFSVTANNVPDGQILNWTVKEGALNSGSNDITAPDKSESGTAILRNGIAYIDFITTPDDNADESQKHVRLTIGAPASLSINVPINDLGNTESIVHITQSTTNGIQLDEYYKQQSGAYPTSTDNIRFIVDEGVDIIAPDTDTPAITEGANWPAESQPVVENHGRILGRGGDGGKAAIALYFDIVSNGMDSVTTIPAESGGDGGTAIKGDITVDNYGLIAGGGGGGGGAGLFTVDGYGGSSGGAGGGAPLGKRYANPKTYEDYLENFPTTEKYTLPPLANPTTGITYDLYNELTINIPDSNDDSRRSYIRGDVTGLSGGERTSDIIRFDGFKHYLDGTQERFYIPYYLDDSKVEYKQWAWGTNRGWVDIGLRQSTSATVDQRGLGGINLHNLGSTLSTKYIAEIPNYDVTKNKGGDGGAFGELGQASLLSLFHRRRYVNDSDSELVTELVPKSELDLFLEPKDGGLAGFVKEGDVTITNYSAGTTKGR